MTPPSIRTAKGRAATACLQFVEPPVQDRGRPTPRPVGASCSSPKP
jgi:hypothetical protein